MSAFMFLKTLWELFPSLVNESTGTASQISEHLQQAAVDEDSEQPLSLKITVHSLLFHLMQFLTHESDPNAGLIFKILLFSLENNFRRQSVREHILSNFSRLLEKFPKLPISKLIHLVTK